MKTKIICMLFCFLMIASAVPVSTSLNNKTTIQMISNGSDHLHQQVNWNEIQKLLASDGGAGDGFGWSVSLSGNTALIGAAFDADNGLGAGSAYVFIRTDTTWTQQAKLLAPDGEQGYNFGYSVSLSGDTALIGEPYDAQNGCNSGSAYIYTRTGTTWIQQAKILPSDGAAGDNFGNSVSLDGDTALIGASSDNDNGYISGSAYIFTRTGTTWIQQAKLLPSDGAPYSRFGCSVSLHLNTALIGAYWDDGNEVDSGSSYVFIRTGTTWEQQAKLLAFDGVTDDLFGYAVALHGNTALIGTYADDDNGAYSGSAYVFTRNDTTWTWTYQAKLLASDGATFDFFGYSVALSDNTVFIGAMQNIGNGQYSGAMYVFIRTQNTWMQQARLLSSDGAGGDCFGCSVSLDSNTALIGAFWDDNNENDSGSAYIFTGEGENQPPFPPTIDGPSWGIIHSEYVFYTNVTDPDGDALYCNWNWDDGSTSGWIGPYFSGEMISVSHEWSQKRTYLVRVKIKDTSDQQSEWSEAHPIHIYEIQRVLVFLSVNNIINITTQKNFTFVQVRKACIVLFKPFEFHRYITERNITYMGDMYWGMISQRLFMAVVNLVNNLNDQIINN